MQHQPLYLIKQIFTVEKHVIGIFKSGITGGLATADQFKFVNALPLPMI
jgi:hypothetical protein